VSRQPASLPAALQRGSCSAADWARPAAEPPSPDLPWPEFSTPAILALLTGRERKPLREVCRAGRDAVDAGITRLELGPLSSWGGDQGGAPWAGAPLGAVSLPALRHLNLSSSSSGWEQHGAVHMRGAARLVAAHAASLRTLNLNLYITSELDSYRELAALEVGFLESVLLAAPLPALQRFDLSVEFLRADEARCLEALRPLARLSLPRLARLSLYAGAATGQGVRWLEGAHLPALRHLWVADYRASTVEHPCVAALTAPRWSALEALDLRVDTSGGGMAALSVALAPTLRRLVVGRSWPFDEQGCAEEWLQLRSLEVKASGTLVEQLGPVRLPRLERLAARLVCTPAFLDGFAARRPSIPALRVVELQWCWCDNKYGCPVVGCVHPRTVALLAELRAAWPGLELRRLEEEDWTQA
jgi:hypothetical protein